MSKSYPSASEQNQDSSPTYALDNVDAAEVQADPGKKQDLDATLDMSLLRAIAIILTCTMAMVVNVCLAFHSPV